MDVSNGTMLNVPICRRKRLKQLMIGFAKDAERVTE